MNKRNYSKELDAYIEDFQKKGEYPKLLLHACCAPCSSYCLEFLRNYFDVTVFFYNPNITEDAEYHKRVQEEKRLIGEYNQKEGRKIEIIEGEYKPSDFFDAVRGYEDCSPLKNADVLNEVGEIAAREIGARFLPSDFKKKEGYKRSIELSKEYGLYRQDFCGCSFSKAQRELEKSAASSI